MDLFLPTTLLTLVLSAGLTEPQPPPDCEASRSLLELGPEPTDHLPVVCITPGLVTALLFGSPIIPASVVLRGEAHFEPLEPGSHHLVLLPRDTLQPGTRLELELRFEDGASPSHVTLTLLVHPARLLRQVRVERRGHTVEFYQQRAEQAQAEAQRYQEALSRLQTQSQGEQGLRGLLRMGVIMGPHMVRGFNNSENTSHATAGLKRTSVWAYQATGRAALDVWLTNEGSQPWLVAGASLVGPQGERVDLLPPGPQDIVQPGATQGQVILETGTLKELLQGPYTLTLWSADALRTVTIEGITFP